MAGYIFSISKDSWSTFCANELSKGYFTPYTVEVDEDSMVSRKRKANNKVMLATFGDLVTMKPGDNIYFLSDRKIYGVGKTINVGEDCKYDNYEDASALLPDCQISPKDYLTTASTRARWVCLFEPETYFFKTGVDMDDVLRYRPAAFKMLRAFENLTFIKIDDDENRALKEYIYLVNEAKQNDIINNSYVFDSSIHHALQERDLTNFRLDIRKVLNYPENAEFVLSEMFIECALLQDISSSAVPAMGNWEYLTHQIIASPFKPLKYIDKIDVFGYRLSVHYPGEPKLITKYLLVEVKQGKINKGALEQTMQYVDWICHEYASGDYSKIEAYVVGDSAVRNISDLQQDICQRAFIASTHPAKPEKWSALHLVKYVIDTNSVSFSSFE